MNGNNPRRLADLSAEQAVIQLFLRDEAFRLSVVNYILGNNSVEALNEALRTVFDGVDPPIASINALTRIFTQEGSFFLILRRATKILNIDGVQRINESDVNRYLDAYETTMIEIGQFSYMNLLTSIYGNTLNRLSENLSARERLIFGILSGNNPNEMQTQLSRGELRDLFEIDRIANARNLNEFRTLQLLDVLITAATPESRNQLFVQISNLLTFIKNQNLVDAVGVNNSLNVRLHYTIFRSAIGRGLYDFADRIMGRNQSELLINYRFAFVAASIEGRVDILDRILNSMMQENVQIAMFLAATNDRAFREAAQSGHTQVLEYLLTKAESPDAQRATLGANYYGAFRAAAQDGNTEILNYLLKAAERLDVQRAMLEAGNYEAFIHAARDGNTKMLDSLLNAAEQSDVQRAMLEAGDYIVFIYAARNGNTEILSYLLNAAEQSDVQRAMLKARNYEAFRAAAKNGHTKVLEYLLTKAESPDVQRAMLGANNHEAFRAAAKNGHTKVLEYLLTKAESPDVQRAMLGANDYEAFRLAINTGNTETLKSLLDAAEQSGVLSAMLEFHNYGAFTFAVCEGKTGVLGFLWDAAGQLGVQSEMLQANGYGVFRFAARRGNTKVLDFLWDAAGQLGVRSKMLSANNYEALYYVIRNSETASLLREFVPFVDGNLVSNSHFIQQISIEEWKKCLEGLVEVIVLILSLEPYFHNFP